jgi:site-specific DNA-methyltransferase (adenine-specific)
MKDIPDKSVDMILCDLPYGTTSCQWDSVIPFDDLWVAYKRIIKDNGAIVLFGSEPFTSLLIQSQIELFRYDLIWDKQRGCDFLNANRKPMKSHENLVVFYKKSPTYNKQYWFSTPYKKNNGDEKQHSVYHDSYNVDTESADGKRNPLSIISFPRDGSRMHPTQKPVALCEYLIKTYTNDGDTVLDNCMGSGSTGVACINTNRNFVGIELNAEYFDIAKKRIEEANFYRW